MMLSGEDLVVLLADDAEGDGEEDDENGLDGHDFKDVIVDEFGVKEVLLIDVARTMRACDASRAWGW